MSNPLQSKSPSWLARSIAALTATVAIALACSSGKELPPLAAGGSANTPGTGGVKTGACKDGATAACSMTLSQHNGVLACYHGTQTCLGGVWSGCDNGEVTYQPDVGTGSDSTGTHTQALSTPTSCLTNPCDPTCQVFNEIPDGSLVAEAGVRWPWLGGTLSGVASPSPGLNQPCKTGNDCQFNTYCSNVATNTSCAHDKCTSGTGLQANCDSCVSDVCAIEPSCCTGCKPGEILSPSGKHCYYASPSTTNVDWPTARTACQGRGTGWDLTSITDDAENSFIWAKIGLYAHIGLTDAAVEGTWQWADGEATTYTHWDTGQPSGGASENCARLNSTGVWHDWPCTGTNSTGPYICEGPSLLTNACSHTLCSTGSALPSSCDSCVASICATRPSCCSTAWDSTCVGMVPTTCGRSCPCATGETLSYDQQSCYYKTTTGTAWATAQTTCKARGTGWDLAKIPNAAADSQLTGMISGNTWFGLNDLAVEGTFVWPDGSALGSFGSALSGTPWGNGQPNNNGSSQDCGELRTDGTWNDQTCTNSEVALCEGPAAGQPTWTQHCADLVSTTCDVSCGNGSGMCLPWTPGMTDTACTGVDLTVGPPCDGTIPICNHGKTQAPAGITVSNLPTGSGLFGTCNPSLSGVTGVQTCTTTAPIAPGQCVDVTGCAGLTTTRDIVVNASGAQAECGCRDNWATYTPGTACTGPLCAEITRGSTGTNTKLDLYVLVSTEGAMFDPWWTSPMPAKSALTEFVQAAANAGVAVELNLINQPLSGCGHDGTCNATTCGAADVPLGTLTTAAAPTDTQENALITGINSMTTSQWSQGWSLSTALQGTIARASAHKLTAPTENHAVVLIGTDIWGNACNTTLAQAQSAVATGVANGVKTYAIDVADWSISNYDALASSGGTGTAFRGYDTANPSNLTNKKAPIRAALDAIVAGNVSVGGTTSIACSYPIGSRPINTAGAQVTWTAASGTTTTLNQVAGSGSCANGGYYYDNATSPSSITLCPTTCSTIQGSAGARLDIKIPCVPVYTNRVTRQIYEAQCPVGTAPQWSLFSYDATTPEDSSVTMTFRTALTTTDLSSTPTVPLATASATSTTGQVCAMCGTGCGSSSSCPIDLFNKLNGLPAARLPVLELIITLNPSTPTQLSPLLNSWKVTYSCPPAE